MRTADLYNGRARSYVQGRPGYPLEALAPLRSVGGVAPPADVADIGAGTGILTGVLLQLGYRVHAVEPNDAMRQEADRAHRHKRSYRCRAGTAEHTGLPDRSVDAIAVGQALHWFASEPTRSEFRRILRPGGALTALWNEMGRSCCSFCKDLDSVLASHLHSYVAAQAQQPDPVELVAAVTRPVRSADVHKVSHRQQVTEEGLWHRVHSTSYAPRSGDPVADELRRAMAGLFAAHAENGLITLHYKTTVVTATPS